MMMNILLFSDTNKPTFRTTMTLVLLTSILLSPHGLADPPKTYGGAEVEMVVKIYEDYTVSCDIKDWPEIIGSDIKVTVKGVEPPEIVLSGGKPNTFFKLQLKKFMKKAFDDAEHIKLENIERAETFALKSQIVLDGKKLTDLLIEAGLARIKVPGVTIPEAPKRVGSETARPTTKKQPKQNIKVGESLVASKNSKVYHRASCSFVKRITQDNRVSFNSKGHAEQTGRRPCKTCKP